VDGTGDEFFSSAGLADDKNVRVVGRATLRAKSNTSSIAGLFPTIP
jgi:hypothetical protein